MNPRARALFLIAMMAVLLVFPLAAHAQDPACGYVTYTPSGGSSQDLLPLERCSRSSCSGVGHGPSYYQNGMLGRVEFFLCVRWV